MTDATAAKTTKLGLVRELLERRGGASLGQLCQATGWQEHSVRAAMSGLRKAGLAIERTAPKAEGEEARYRITGRPGAGT